MLHDVDRGHADRANPMPNGGDVVFQRMAHGIVSTNYQTPLTNPGTTQGLQSGYFRMVFSRTIQVVNDGSTLTTYSDTHGLGYVPMALAAINDSNYSSALGTIHHASIFLPTFTSASIGGVTAGIVSFGTYLYHFVDSENIYINLANATGNPVSIYVTYYLFSQAATG